LSAEQICKECGVPATCIEVWTRMFGIDRIPKCNAHCFDGGAVLGDVYDVQIEPLESPRA